LATHFLWVEENAGSNPVIQTVMEGWNMNDETRCNYCGYTDDRDKVKIEGKLFHKSWAPSGQGETCKDRALNIIAKHGSL
jgi:hypothetical protein